MPPRPRRRKPDPQAAARQLPELRMLLAQTRRQRPDGTTGGWRRRMDVIRNLEREIAALEAAVRPPPSVDYDSLPF